MAIESYGEKVACEIDIATNYAWETWNMIESLADGYDKVHAVSSGPNNWTEGDYSSNWNQGWINDSRGTIPKPRPTDSLSRVERADPTIEEQKKRPVPE